MNKAIRIMLADDHPLFRDGVRHLLEEQSGLKIVGVAGSGEEAVTMAIDRQPDLILLDISMPDIEGPEVVELCRQGGVRSEFIFLTMHKYGELLRKAVSLGVRGYVLKDCGANEVIEAVKSVADGKDYLSPAVSGLLVKELRSCAGGGSTAGIESLTAVQRRVLKLVASDRISKEIAGELGLSVRTVENHRARICRKLGLSGAHSLVKFAFDHRDQI